MRAEVSRHLCEDPRARAVRPELGGFETVDRQDANLDERQAVHVNEREECSGAECNAGGGRRGRA